MWNGSKRELLDFMSKLKTVIQPKILIMAFPKNRIYFLSTTVYKNKEQKKLLATLYCKLIDRKTFFHHKYVHLKSLTLSWRRFLSYRNQSFDFLRIPYQLLPTELNYVPHALSCLTCLSASLAFVPYVPSRLT